MQKLTKMTYELRDFFEEKLPNAELFFKEGKYIKRPLKEKLLPPTR